MGLNGRHDAVVVGAGAGGAAAAFALTGAGLEVLLLEAGPRFEPARDYPLTAPDWERRGFPEKPGSRGEFRWGDLGDFDPESDLASHDAVAGRLVPGPAREVAGGGYAHVRGVGGSTLHYTGEAHRMHPAAMRLRSETGAGRDWPIDYATLEPHYARAEALIGVAGPEAPGARWRSTPMPQPAHPLSPGAEVLADAGARLGIDWQANARAALSRPFDGRPACNYCGNCGRGCPIGDKGSADVTFLRRAAATGRLTLVPDTPVIGLSAGPDGRVTHLDCIHEGHRNRVETPLLFLAGGAVETPRLLLAAGLANGSGEVGRNFIETLGWSSTAFVPGTANTHMGLPADAVSWHCNRPGSVPGTPGGCRFTHATQELGLVGPMAYAGRLIPGHGAALQRELRARFGTAVAISALGEKLPDAESRVTLHPNAADRHGLALPVIRSRLAPADRRLLAFMARTARAHLAEAGAGAPVEETGTLDRFESTHVFGTCAMGTDAAKSVVGPDCRSHDHPNLYIADAGVLPTGGGGEAPALTVQALALRAAGAATD